MNIMLKKKSRIQQKLRLRVLRFAFPVKLEATAMNPGVLVCLVQLAVTLLQCEALSFELGLVLVHTIH